MDIGTYQVWQKVHAAIQLTQGQIDLEEPSGYFEVLKKELRDQGLDIVTEIKAFSSGIPSCLLPIAFRSHIAPWPKGSFCIPAERSQEMRDWLVQNSKYDRGR